MSESERRSTTIYTDGACSANGQTTGAKAGIGVYWPDNPNNNISEPLDGRQTNQRAEIVAARRGIEQAKSQGYDKLVVKTDSAYVKNAVESWIPNWERQGWSKSIVNKTEFQDLKNSMRDIDVTFEKVQSKSNAADSLAKSGAMRGASNMCRKFGKFM